MQVELDINQNDFRKLNPKQKGIITTDAYPDKKYEGIIDEISPEANRQKATVQVKVKVLAPDDLLRPEMNACVAFYESAGALPADGSSTRQLTFVPANAIKDGKLLLFSNGIAVERKVKAGTATSQGIRIEEGLTGGEDVILNPPAELKNGDRVERKK